MSQRKIVFLTVLVLLLFGFIFLFERKMPTTSEAKEKKDLVWELPEDQIESLRLERPDSIVELKKTGPSSWRLVRPDAYPADAATADDVASQLAKLRRSGGESAEARPEDYGLSSEAARTPGAASKPPAASGASTRATIVWKDPANPSRRLSRTLEFGVEIPGTDATAARVLGGSTVIFVPSTIAAAVRKKADDFKSKDVFGGAGAEIAKLDVDRGRGRVSLVRRDGVWWLSQPVADLADGDAAQRFVDELTGMKVLEFLPASDRQNLAGFGLAPPLYRVTLAQTVSAASPGPTSKPAGSKSPAPGAPAGASTSVELGATRSDGNSVYARRESQVFTVSSTVVEDLSREAVAFREPRLVRFDRAAVSSLDGAFGAEKMSLARKDAGWTSGGKPVTAAAVDDLMSAILDVKSRAFSDEAAAEALKPRTPSAVVTVRLAGNQTWILSVYPGGQALVSGRPGAFALASDPTAVWLAAFRKAAAKK
jgi:hypothetical protein